MSGNRSICIIINKGAGRVTEVSGVAGVVPNRLAAAVAETTEVGMILVSVDAANLVGSHDKFREGVDVFGQVAKGPVVDLDGLGVEVFDLDIFIRFV